MFNKCCERELKLIYSKHNVFSIDDLWSLCQEPYHQVTNRFIMRQCTVPQNIVHHPKFKCSDVQCIFLAILGDPIAANASISGLAVELNKFGDNLLCLNMLTIFLLFKNARTPRTWPGYFFKLAALILFLYTRDPFFCNLMKWKSKHPKSPQGFDMRNPLF